MTPHAVLWDLDGTLVDSAEYHWQSWRHAMSAEGLEVSHRQFLESFGQKNDRILASWLGPAAHPDRIHRIADVKEREYRRLARERGLTPLPGAADWLERLHRDGWRQAIASSAPRANVEVMLSALKFDRLFDAIVSAEDVTAGKPDPQAFLQAAGKVGAPRSQCVVVEDAAAGIEAARRAGMRSIGVSRTATLDADVFVRSLQDLPPDAFTVLLARSTRG